MKEEDTLIYHETLDNYHEIINFPGRKIKIEDNDEQIYLINDDLYYQNTLFKKWFSKLYPGLHNVLNLKMAIACVNIFNISFDSIKEAINTLEIPNFRLSKVYQKNNLIIYNDSKSTNPLAFLSAVESLKTTNNIIYWIGGGKKRGDNWNQLEKVFKTIDKIFLYGENRFEIVEELNKIGSNYIIKNTLDEIINTLPKNFNQPTIILFSPASQSFDQFSNYNERGEYFNKLITEYYK